MSYELIFLAIYTAGFLWYIVSVLVEASTPKGKEIVNRILSGPEAEGMPRLARIILITCILIVAILWPFALINKIKKGKRK